MLQERQRARRPIAKVLAANFQDKTESTNSAYVVARIHRRAEDRYWLVAKQVEDYKSSQILYTKDPHGNKIVLMGISNIENNSSGCSGIF